MEKNTNLLQNNCNLNNNKNKLFNIPEVLKKRVSLSKVNLNIIKDWIQDELYLITNQEDKSLVDFIINMLEEEDNDPIKIYNYLDKFIGKNAENFVINLWRLLLDSENNKISNVVLLSKLEYLKKINKDKRNYYDNLNNIILKIKYNNELKFRKSSDSYSDSNSSRNSISDSKNSNSKYSTKNIKKNKKKERSRSYSK